MDGTTEPLIAVIGHPIAGNPSQFAIERALHAMKLEWRVMSFDVKPQDVATALDGFAVTGITGVMVDPSVALQATQWLQRKTDPGIQDPSQPSTSDQPESPDSPVAITALDCLSRGDGPDVDSGRQPFRGTQEQRRWIDELIQQHGGEQRIWIGDSLQQLPLTAEAFPATAEDAPPNPDSIASANVIVITSADQGPPELEVDDWPGDDGSTLVIDLTEGHPDCAAIAALGYRVIAPLQRRVGTLSQCLQRWTGQTPPEDVLHDAIEEYLAV